MTLKLAPENGWINFTEHNKLNTYMYDCYNDRLHKVGWKYMNFTIDTAIFEDPNGNYVLLTYSDPDKPTIAELFINIDRKIDQEQINVLNVQEGLMKRFNLRVERE